MLVYPQCHCCRRAALKARGVNSSSLTNWTLITSGCNWCLWLDHVEQHPADSAPLTGLKWRAAKAAASWERSWLGIKCFMLIGRVKTCPCLRLVTAGSKLLNPTFTKLNEGHLIPHRDAFRDPSPIIILMLRNVVSSGAPPPGRCTSSTPPEEHIQAELEDEPPYWAAGGCAHTIINIIYI